MFREGEFLFRKTPLSYLLSIRCKGLFIAKLPVYCVFASEGFGPLKLPLFYPSFIWKSKWAAKAITWGLLDFIFTSNGCSCFVVTTFQTIGWMLWAYLVQTCSALVIWFLISSPLCFIMSPQFSPKMPLLLIPGIICRGDPGWSIGGWMLLPFDNLSD